MKYEKPRVEIIRIENEDVIVASPNDAPDGAPCYGTNGEAGTRNNVELFRTKFACWNEISGAGIATNTAYSCTRLAGGLGVGFYPNCDRTLGIN